MKGLQGLLDLGLVMIPDPIAEEFVGDSDLEGVVFGQGGLGGLKPGLEALAIEVFFEALQAAVWITRLNPLTKKGQKLWKKGLLNLSFI
jgi:hypothetical protein